MKKSTYIFIIFLICISFDVQARLELSYTFERPKIIPDFYLEREEELVIPEFNVKGIYVTGWVAGTEKMDNLINLVEDTILNTMVIDIKDDHGYLSYNSSIPLAEEIGANHRKIKDLPALLKKLNGKGIYTIARIVLFRDSLLATKRPDLALNLNHIDSKEIIKSSIWANPFRKTIWEYNIQVAKDAVEMGFDEIQFDYIRYPAQTGLTLQPVVPEDRSKRSIINDFSDYALSELAEYNIPVSLDVFGLTTTAKDDLGIGQDFSALAEKYKIISPMIYPSHYSRGIYGIDNPALEPYRLINRSLKDALKKIDYNDDIVIRPWLQDFTINDRYTHNEVLEQIKAVEDLGIKEWLLWNPGSNYQKEALVRPSF